MKHLRLLGVVTFLVAASPAVAQETVTGGDTSRCSKCELAIIGILADIRDTSKGIKSDTAPIGAKLDALTAAVKELTAAVRAAGKKAPIQLSVSLPYIVGHAEQQQDTADKHCKSLGYAKASQIVEVRPPERLNPNRTITSVTCHD